MATAIQKITLSTSRDIAFNKLVLSQANVRRVQAGVSIEELAEDIARRTLLQGLSVRAVVDAHGNETGMFEVPAGGRRFPGAGIAGQAEAPGQDRTRAVRGAGRRIAEEDSLAENVQRVALHPLDQFRAFQALREKGVGDEEIAARFFVNPTVVNAAPAPGRGVAEAARHLCRGRHDAGANDGVHGLPPIMRARSRFGIRCRGPTARNLT